MDFESDTAFSQLFLDCTDTEMDNVFLKEMEEQIEKRYEKEQRSKQRQTYSFGEQLLNAFKAIPYHIAYWDHTGTKYIVYNWDTFVRFVTKTPDHHPSETAHHIVMNIFRRAGVILEVDVDLNNPGEDNLIHKIHHPLLIQNDYEKARQLGWYGPVAVPTDNGDIDKKIAIELFPEVKDMADFSNFEPL